MKLAVISFSPCHNDVDGSTKNKAPKIASLYYYDTLAPLPAAMKRKPSSSSAARRWKQICG